MLIGLPADALGISMASGVPDVLAPMSKSPTRQTENLRQHSAQSSRRDTKPGNRATMTAFAHPNVSGKSRQRKKVGFARRALPCVSVSIRV
jgi:hypothetical protein